MPAKMRYLSVIVLACAACALVGVAQGQPTGDKAAAEALFVEGRALMKRGDNARACEKFAASHRVQPSVGALLNLGDCQEKLGKLASAWASFREAAALARQLGDATREEFAMQRAEVIHERLSYLIIEVPEDSRVTGLAITRNREPVDQSLWNERAPVDPGPYVIRAEAPGHQPLEIRIEVQTAADQVTVRISGLQPLPGREPRQTRVPEREPRRARPAAPRPAQDGVAEGMPARRKLALVSSGVAATGLAAGVIVGLRAQERWNDALALCDDLVCSDSNYERALELAAQARRLGLAANISYVAAGLAAATGGYLWFTARPRRAGDDTRDASVLVPVIAPGMTGVMVRVTY